MADYSIFIFHILFVGPLLILIGVYHHHPNFPKIMWDIITILGIGIIIYHSLMMYNRYTLINSK
jgi:hypothetical protein